MKKTVKFLRGEAWGGEGDLIGIKGKIGKILNKYEFEVYLFEEKGIKYYEFFYHPTHSSIDVRQSTEITEQEIIDAFKYVLSIFKNPVEKQKIIDDYIIKDQQTTRWEIENNKKEMDTFEKHIEDFILEVEGIKKRPDIRARFRLLKKVGTNLWEYKTDKYIFRLEKFKHKNIWDEYSLQTINIERTEEEGLNNYSCGSRFSDGFEHSIVYNLEADNIEQKAKELIDWTKAYKGIPWDALDGEREYKISLREDGSLRALAKDDLADENYPWEFSSVLDGMDIYDKDGNCLMTMKKFEKIKEKMIQDRYKQLIMENKMKKEENLRWYTGYNYFLRGKYEKAMEIYDEVINKEHSEYGYFLMGLLNKKLKKYDKAIENFTMYIEHSKDNKRKSNGYGHRGLIKLKMALNKEAFEDLMKSIELTVENRKKYIKQEELDDFYKILKTYKQGNVNNPEKRKYSIPIDISVYFKSCVGSIGEYNNYALSDLQHLSNMYSEISNLKEIHKG